MHPSVENAPRILSVRRSLLALVGRKQTVRSQRSAFSSENTLFAPLILAHKGSALPWLVDDRATIHTHSPNLVLTIYVQQHTSRLRVLWRSTRLSATAPPVSRVPPPPPERRAPNKLELGRGAPDERHQPQPTNKPPPRLNRPDNESRRQPVGCISRG